MHTRLEWKGTNVRSITITVTQKDSNKDDMSEEWCRDKGSEEH
jgi:hypothetical protein